MINYLNSIETCFRFRGTVDRIEDLPLKANCGDIFCVGRDAEYLFNGNEWDLLGHFNGEDESAKIQSLKPTITNCPNCNAPLMIDKIRHDGTCKCEFCGSFVYMFAKEDKYVTSR